VNDRDWCPVKSTVCIGILSDGCDLVCVRLLARAAVVRVVSWQVYVGVMRCLCVLSTCALH